MSKFIQALKSLKRKPLQLRPSKAFTAEQLKQYIQDSESEYELLRIEQIADEQSFDGEFTENEQFELCHQVAQMLALFVYIEDNFPHSYYPPFALEAHIKCATTTIALYAIGLHFKINRQVYFAKGINSTQLKIYEHKIREQLELVTLEKFNA